MRQLALQSWSALFSAFIKVAWGQERASDEKCQAQLSLLANPCLRLVCAVCVVYTRLSVYLNNGGSTYA